MGSPDGATAAAVAAAPAAGLTALPAVVALRRHCEHAQAVSAKTINSSATPQPTATAIIASVPSTADGETVADAVGTAEHAVVHGTPLTAAVAPTTVAGAPAAASAANIAGIAAVAAAADDVSVARPALTDACCADEADAGTSTDEV